MAEQVLTAQEVQALHRRLVQAAAEGREPSAEDARLRDELNASPYAAFDRPWGQDAK